MDTRDARGGVLVLGGGFAGAYVARLLGERGATIVSLENFMLFTPLLPEAASGTLEPRHCVVPLRVMCPHADLLLGRVAGVDLAARTAHVQTDEGIQDVAWRELVLALGEALAELADLVEDASRYYPRVAGVPRRWVLVDAAPKILPEIPSRLGEYRPGAHRARSRDPRGNDCRVGHRGRGDPQQCHAHSDAHARLDSGRRTEPATARARPAARRARPRRGGRAAPRPGATSTCGLGDCARVPNRMSEHPDPRRASMRFRQARRLAKNIVGDPEPHGYRMLGQVATLGRYKGIADVHPEGLGKQP
jgi:NADH dehydrogenase FAD-containing subunit